MTKESESVGATPTGVLTALEAGMVIPFGGRHWVRVDEGLARAFRPGDRLLVLQTDGTLIHVTAAVAACVEESVTRAREAFGAMRHIDQSKVTDFYRLFAERLRDESVFARIARANEADVSEARSKGRAVGRLMIDEKMRQSMIEGLELWRHTDSVVGASLEHVDHSGWYVDVVRAPLGVVAFVFEGRPNVFADATGVLRGGNSTVMRIGSDALGTARAIMELAVRPSLADAGLPSGAVELIDEADRSGGHALFSDSRVSLAVARGSGPAVAQLGAVARQSGVPVSLHGTGGAWMIVCADAPDGRVRDCVSASLDKKVCNTVNVIVLVGHEDRILREVLGGVIEAARGRDAPATVHLLGDSARSKISLVPGEVDVRPGEIVESSTEWEWDDSPEVSIVMVDEVDEAIDLFNDYSPRFIVSALTGSEAKRRAIVDRCDAPFVGDGFTRWVDGQYALRRPELGLSNWQEGRLFARGGILSGDAVYSVRYHASTPDATQRR
ncbi:MAG: aldehyde dehydrogenase family protein [Actinobacteria bacterium]|nr:aldehyde dehydrogenase family protein [Actinomycetota bacterium]